MTEKTKQKIDKIVAIAFTIVALVVIGVAMLGCSETPEEHQQKMIEQAKMDAEKEAEFKDDSIKLANTFEVKHVDSLFYIEHNATDDDGNPIHWWAFYAKNKDNTVCQLKKEKYDALLSPSRQLPDTLRCQWSTKIEDNS